MGNILTRNPYTDETPILKDIWKTVFGEDGLASFFGLLYSEQHTIIAEAGGKPAAMGYIVPMGELICGGAASPCANALKCVMLYAIATMPQHRGKGLGAAVVNKLIETAYELGYAAAVLAPSSDSLFDYYSARTPLREWFYASGKGISAFTTTPVGAALCGRPQKSAGGHAGPPLQTLSPAQYGDLREKLLAGTPHIRHSQVCLEYQEMLCNELGGGLFQIDNSCAAIELQPSGAVSVKELLIAPKDDERAITIAITSAFPSNACEYRLPAQKGQGTRFAMLAMQGDAREPSPCVTDAAPWYGLAFD